MAVVDKPKMAFIKPDCEITVGMIITFKGFGKVDGTPFRVEQKDGKTNSLKLVEVKPL